MKDNQALAPTGCCAACCAIERTSRRGECDGTRWMSLLYSKQTHNPEHPSKRASSEILFAKGIGSAT
ncbi:MAG: hypothetical protein WCL44_11900, partial [bacterium]